VERLKDQYKQIIIISATLIIFFSILSYSMFIKEVPESKLFEPEESESRIRYNESSGEFLDEPMDTAGETAEVT